MTRERILTTTPSRSVLVTTPDEWCISALMRGGAWDDFPWLFWVRQFQQMLFDGIKPRAAYRYARMMVTGGCSRREAIEIIAERDCGHLGTAIEIVDIDEIPKDRTYRDAWCRSQNGGPIYIDEDHAQRIDEARMWEAFYETT